MTAVALNMHEWIIAFHASVEDRLYEIHPSARGICREWIIDMHQAADAGDAEEVARLMVLTHDKIADELIWEEDKLRSATDPSYVPRCVRHG
jgi:hypothetical protein